MTPKEMFDRASSRRLVPEEERTRLRDRANSLLGFEPFVDWLGDLMVEASYFGEGRELTAYQQGLRGGVVRAVEALLETADDGDKVIARVFREKIRTYVK